MGLRIGKGETLQQIVGGMTAVAEGVLTSRHVSILCTSPSSSLHLSLRPAPDRQIVCVRRGRVDSRQVRNRVLCIFVRLGY